MKKINVLAATALVAAGTVFTSCNSRKSAKLTNSVDSASYAIGLVIGSNYRMGMQDAPGEPLNIDVLTAAFEQALKNDSAAFKMTAENAGMYVQQYFREAEMKQAQQTKEEGDKFLAENKTKNGVITTESGLQYQVIKEGEGPKPAATDKVKVHYKGTFLDGTEFDSSYGPDGNGKPVDIQLGPGQVIEGWNEGLQIMPVGSKYIFWIPSELGYGERSRPGMKANSTLKFEVELVEIVKEDPAAAPKK